MIRGVVNSNHEAIVRLRVRRLIAGHKLVIHVIARGPVEITSLP